MYNRVFRDSDGTTGVGAGCRVPGSGFRVPGSVPGFKVLPVQGPRFGGSQQPANRTTDQPRANPEPRTWNRTSNLEPNLNRNPAPGTYTMQLVDLFASSLVGQADEVAIEYRARQGRPATLTLRRAPRPQQPSGPCCWPARAPAGDRLDVTSPTASSSSTSPRLRQLGVVLVPINVLYREREIAHIIGDAEPRDRRHDAWRAFARLPAPLVDVDELTARGAPAAGERRPRAIDGDAPAAIVYTSGTTGTLERRGADAQQLRRQRREPRRVLADHRGDRYLAVLPLFHVHGLGNGVCAWLASGCRMRLVERFDIRAALELFAGLPADAVLRRADDLRAAAGAAAGRRRARSARGCGCSSRARRRCRRRCSSSSASGSATPSSSATA